MNRPSFLILLLFSVLLAACSGGSSGQTKSQLILHDCQLSAPGLSLRLAARCGILAVPENPDGTGPEIQLKIAVIPAVSRNPAPDPLFFLSGGPGQAATETYPQLAAAFTTINQKRDIVLVDQRGTGSSHPLDCPSTPETAPEATDIRREAQACLEALDAQAQFYTTPVAMADLDAVRAALGYPQINLYGVSYGTRAALTYLKLYPERVRTLILDGVVPQDEALGQEVAQDAQRALDLIFERCAAQPECAAAFPNLPQAFDDLRASLRQAPVEVSLPDPTSGVLVDLTFTEGQMAQAVRLLSYAPETAALLPLLIHQATTRQDYAPLAAQYLIVAGQLSESISTGMNFSVLCSEDVPFFDPAEIEAANEGSYLGDLQTKELADICAVWPRGDVPQDFKEPPASDVPVLLLSGQADPVTPPENAVEAAQSLPNSLQIVVPGQGHNVIYRGCLPRLATSFIESGSVAGIDATCVDAIQPMPFFITPSGPYSP